MAVRMDRCDGCGNHHVTALTWWALIRDDYPHDPELYLCGNHGKRHGEAMVRDGWVLVADVRDPVGAG